MMNDNSFGILEKLKSKCSSVKAKKQKNTKKTQDKTKSCHTLRKYSVAEGTYEG